MAENCLNCANPITENFCANCGQKKYKRIEGKYLWDELQYTILHTNKGFLYSVKSILKNPGKTAREFIDGNRVNHYKPILMIFVLSGVSTFISFKVLNFKEVMTEYFAQENLNSNFTGDVMSIISSYSTVIMLMLLPLFALSTKIAFRKWGHNYYEHVVMNAYILSFYTLVYFILGYPILFFFRHSPNAFFNITQISNLVVPVILIWFFKEFYKDKPIKSIVLKVLGVLGLTILGYFFLMLVIGMIGAAFLK